MDKIQIYILSTGSEITSGKSLDTNSMWISGNLTDDGYTVSGFMAYPDDPILLEEGILNLMQKEGKSLIIMTGGLGATGDDHTLNIIKNITKSELIQIKEAYEKLVMVSQKRGQEYIETLKFTVRQTYIPDISELLPNDVGIAPGFYISLTKDCKLAALPGVPVEMKNMFTNYLINFIKRDFPNRIKFYISKHIWLTTEGLYQKDFINKNINFLEENNIEWGVTAKPAHIKVSFRAHEKNLLNNLIDQLKIQYGNKMTDNIIDSIHEILLERNETVSSGESCTGGYVGKLLTDKSGSSGYYLGTVTAYNNNVKMRILNVKEKTINDFGAVSEETANEMLYGLEQLFNSTYNVSITGIAGPTGGTDNKPVGTVFIGIKKQGREPKIYRNHFPHGRESFREATAQIALYYLHQEITN